VSPEKHPNFAWLEGETGLTKYLKCIWSKVHLKPRRMPQVPKLYDSKAQILWWPDHQRLCGQLSSCFVFFTCLAQRVRLLWSTGSFHRSWWYSVRVGWVAVCQPMYERKMRSFQVSRMAIRDPFGDVYAKGGSYCLHLNASRYGALRNIIVRNVMS